MYLNCLMSWLALVLNVNACVADRDNSFTAFGWLVLCCDEEVLLSFGWVVGDDEIDCENGDIVVRLVMGGALYCGGLAGDVKNWRRASTMVCLLLVLLTVTTFWPEMVTQVADLNTLDCLGEFSMSSSFWSVGSGPNTWLAYVISISMSRLWCTVSTNEEREASPSL